MHKHCSHYFRLEFLLKQKDDEIGPMISKLSSLNEERGSLIAEKNHLEQQLSSKQSYLKLLKSNLRNIITEIYRNRSVSIEPLFCTVKETFGISTSPVSGFDNVSSYLLMCVFVYQITVYYNCILGNNNPRSVRGMLGN